MRFAKKRIDRLLAMSKEYNKVQMYLILANLAQIVSLFGFLFYLTYLIVPFSAFYVYRLEVVPVPPTNRSDYTCLPTPTPTSDTRRYMPAYEFMFLNTAAIRYCSNTIPSAK